VKGQDGNFYGTTFYGGTNSRGTVFKITATGTLTTLHSFSSTTGRYPRTRLVLASDGNFYGTNGDGSLGGVTDYGFVYRITPAGAVTKLVTFNSTNGSNPYAGLIQGSDGDFYSVTSSGGTSREGTVFKMNASGGLTTLHHFTFLSGREPCPKLELGDDGCLYGLTSKGGASGLGTVFKIAPSGTVTTLHSFNGNDGSYPADGLEQASDGYLYGVTSSGGPGGYGTVFKVSPTGSLSTVYAFSYGTNGSNPYFPQNGVVEGSDGNFYGLTTFGGGSGYGVIYRVTPSGTLAILHHFNGYTGLYPYSSLVKGSDDNFYGTTADGGSSLGYADGSVFKISPSGTFTTLHYFTSFNANTPLCGLVQGQDGNFYGATSRSGLGLTGSSLYRISLSGALTTLHHFTSRDEHENRAPTSALTLGSDGAFYGTSQDGRIGKYGTIFKVTSEGGFTTLHKFDGTTGADPLCTPVFGVDGHLYGVSYPMVVWRLRNPNPVSTLMASKGYPVPHAGVSGSGIPAGAVWSRLGVPSINEVGQVAVYGEWRARHLEGGGVFRSGPAGLMLVPSLTRGAASSGLPNLRISTLNEPVLGPDGSLLCQVGLANAPGMQGAVTSANDLALMLDHDGPGVAPATVIARKGSLAPGFAIGRWLSFDSVALGNQVVAIVGRLVHSGAITNLNDQGIWLYDRHSGQLRLALSEGQALMGSNIKLFHALMPRIQAGGHGSGLVNDGTQEQIAIRLTLANGKSAVGTLSANGTLGIAQVTGDAVPGFGAGARWSHLGLPGQNAVGALAFVGRAKGGTARASNRVGVFAEDESTWSLVKRVAKGDDAPGFPEERVFAGFSDPVLARGGALAFAGSTTPPFPDYNKQRNTGGLWYDDGETLRLVAREGAVPPGTPHGTQWNAFPSIALVERRGPLFYATLKVGTESLTFDFASFDHTINRYPNTAANDTGIWAMNSFGITHKLIQEGDPFGTSTVRSFQALLPVSGSPAQTKSFNSSGEVVMQVTDATGGTHLLHVQVP
jgi:uncharacterized repeat protein (TIGR03803 family)